MLRSQTTKLTLRNEDLKEYESVRRSWSKKEPVGNNSNSNFSSSNFDNTNSNFGISRDSNAMMDERVNNIKSRIGLRNSSP